MNCKLSSLCEYRKEKVNVGGLNKVAYVSFENIQSAFITVCFLPKLTSVEIDVSEIRLKPLN